MSIESLIYWTGVVTILSSCAALTSVAIYFIIHFWMNHIVKDLGRLYNHERLRYLMARLKVVGVDAVIQEEAEKHLIKGSEIILTLIPRKVITADFDCIPTKFKWKWFSRIQRVKLNMGSKNKSRYSYYSLDFKTK